MMNFSILLYVGAYVVSLIGEEYEVFINLGQIWLCRVKLTSIMMV